MKIYKRLDKDMNPILVREDGLVLGFSEKFLKMNSDQLEKVIEDFKKLPVYRGSGHDRR